MAQPKPPKTQTAELEDAVLAKWNKEGTFEQSRTLRKDGPVFSFYDGPPFANGPPHFGHSLVTSIKDTLGRYKTMQGFYVERRNGWDCHGLPVEFAIEKQFGISGKKQILELGLDKFNAACRDSVFAYKHEHEAFFERIGRWADTEHAYATIDTNYTESVWWVMKQIHDKGLLYKGYKSLAYCPRCETPLSNFELNEGYKDDVSDPSLFVKFRLLDDNEQEHGLDAAQGSGEQRTSRTKTYGEQAAQTDDEAMRQEEQRAGGSATGQAVPPVFLLAWTTTPWSLPGNAALAVKPEEDYVKVSLKDESGNPETLILAKKRLADIFKDEASYKIVSELKGSELVGKSYEPLFRLEDLAKRQNHENLYKVWGSESVSIDDGTGVLHVAPAFGEEDLALSLDKKFPVLTTVDRSGHLGDGLGFDEASGKFFKSADRPIIEHLTHKGLVFAAETIQHTYPFCYRCDSPLLYYAVDTWFVQVSSIRDKLLKAASEISWTPDHIKQGRFGKWLEGARDWAISRNRYWGAPMPVWANVDDANDYIVVESIDHLKQLTGADIDVSDLHRPFIDKIEFEKNGKTYRRIEEVIDCWFESGSMPIAQQHYPFENKDKFESSFPADYIGEGLDQTRLWFYVLHVISTILFDKPAYKNVLVNGMITAADGEKLSKRLRNYPPLEEVFSNEGADSLRLYLLSNNQALSGDYMRFSRDGVKDVQRNIVGTLLNSFRFFKMYADIDGWKAPTKLTQPDSQNILDKWILARLNQTITETTKQADDYKLAKAVEPIFSLLDDASNWYIRRSRRRFWKTEDDSDKADAYQTLHFVLVRLSQLLAPWAPFVSDHIYRELMGDKSVHLSDWPKPEKADQDVLSGMASAREIIAEGLRQRAEAKIKVRQPLACLEAPGLSPEYAEIVCDEVNVKEVKAAKTIKLDLEISDALRAEGVIRELIRHIQSLRKSSGLNVEDRITLGISTDDKLVIQAVEIFNDAVKQETLAVELTTATQEHQKEVVVDQAVVEISLAKAKS